ncbi:hypothetical protein RR48_07934 [Papilio machaon]|uniref:Uncharacterized protein n=1 Tax=Papilio machaon TaxID=76193 RepID=A0A194QNJ7_PAPMA|nr:hypothetical protein RR48_07934 [Papilio machaon]
MVAAGGRSGPPGGSRPGRPWWPRYTTREIPSGSAAVVTLHRQGTDVAGVAALYHYVSGRGGHFDHC